MGETVVGPLFWPRGRFWLKAFEVFSRVRLGFNLPAAIYEGLFGHLLRCEARPEWSGKHQHEAQLVCMLPRRCLLGPFTIFLAAVEILQYLFKKNSLWHPSHFFC